MVRRRAGMGVVVGALLLATAGCDGATTRFAPDGGTLPPGLLGSPPPVTPEVLGVWLSGRRESELNVIVRFSVPMSRQSVENALFVQAATEPVRDRGDGTTLRLLGNAEWNPATTEVFWRTEAPGAAAVVVVLTPEARSAAGYFLDGRMGPHPATDPASFHRTENDGYLAPSTYVSLPYYPGGSDDLPTHPSYMLRDQRPGIACKRLDESARPVTLGSLGTYVGGPIACRLWDRRSAPARPNSAERRVPQVWHPERLPTAVFVGADVTVPAEVRAGAAGNLPTNEATVQRAVGLSGLRLTGLNASGDEPWQDVYVTGPGDGERLWAVTGATPPVTLWLDPVLLRSTDGVSFSNDDGPKFRDPSGVAWLRDEWLGQRLQASGDTAVILGNSGNVLDLNDAVICSNCDYQITLDVDERFAQNDRVRLLTPHFTVEPREPLSPGAWRLDLGGGVDVLGYRQTDALRDGDEGAGVVDDTVSLLLTVE